MRHILILELELSGHHGIYLHKIASGFLASGCRVTLGVAVGEIKSEFIADLVAQYGDLVALETISQLERSTAVESGWGDVGRELRSRSLFGSVYSRINKKSSVDLVFLPYADYCLYALALLGSPFGETKWSGICMRPSFHYQAFEVVAPLPKWAVIKKQLFLRLLRSRNLKALFTIDELLDEFVRGRSCLSDRLLYLPDPAEFAGDGCNKSARSHFGLGSDESVVLCYGAIDERKGFSRLMQLLIDSHADDNMRVLLVGRQSDEVRRLLALPAYCRLVETGRLLVIDRFVDTSEQQLAFAACNAVWLGYSGHYTMSGVVVLAGHAQRPVIATSDGLIGWYVRRFSMGELIENTDRDLGKLVRDAAARFAPKRESIRAKFEVHNWRESLSRILAGVRDSHVP